jgi:hypothetical protein
MIRRAELRNEGLLADVPTDIARKSPESPFETPPLFKYSEKSASR